MTEIDLGVELDMSGSQMSMIVSRCKSSSKLQGKVASHPSWSKFDGQENLHWNEVGGKNALDESETTSAAKKTPPASNETDKSSSESAAPKHSNINIVNEVRIVRSMRTCTC